MLLGKQQMKPATSAPHAQLLVPRTSSLPYENEAYDDEVLLSTLLTTVMPSKDYQDSPMSAMNI
eukprot:scaffold432396_cov15-Prasinocladus_malaysianus.AAC.1